MTKCGIINLEILCKDEGKHIFDLGKLIIIISRENGVVSGEVWQLWGYPQIRGGPQTGDGPIFESVWNSGGKHEFLKYRSYLLGLKQDYIELVS